MKKILFIFLLISTAGLSQTAFNTSMASAQFIAQSPTSNGITFTNQPSCSGSQVKLYYYYRSAYNSSGGNVTVFSATSSVNSVVNVVGPFTSLEDAVENYAEPTKARYTSSSATSHTVQHTMELDKIYLMEVRVNSCSATVSLTTTTPTNFSNSWEAPDECIGCITGFRPQAGTYVISAWVKDADAALGTVSYTNPYINVTSGVTTTACNPSGEIIDGWQRIEKEVVIGTDDDFRIDLVCGSSGVNKFCYFDDIRVFPKDGSMVTYVYDPKTLRLMAELDERNYAKIYEYDEQGRLIRVKKETEAGVMTIQENRENNSKE